VAKAVQAWAEAWGRRDMNAYLAAYASDFAGQSGSHKAWEADRRARIEPRKRISVKVEDLSVIVTGDKAAARFRQNYESDTLNAISRKTLTLAKDGSGNWRIQEESVGR
jgi:ketosteroid isomerase-like protein